MIVRRKIQPQGYLPTKNLYHDVALAYYLFFRAKNVYFVVHEVFQHLNYPMQQMKVDTSRLVVDSHLTRR